MRYHYTDEKDNRPVQLFGDVYICDHPVYNSCTLYLIGKRGLAVIQQRFDPVVKATWWTDIDSNFRNDLYLSGKFLDYFNKHADEPNEKGLYPTVTLRQLMYALRMKPLKREPWETAFDHVPI